MPASEVVRVGAGALAVVVAARVVIAAAVVSVLVAVGSALAAAGRTRGSRCQIAARAAGLMVILQAQRLIPLLRLEQGLR